MITNLSKRERLNGKSTKYKISSLLNYCFHALIETFSIYLNCIIFFPFHFFVSLLFFFLLIYSLMFFCFFLTSFLPILSAVNNCKQTNVYICISSGMNSFINDPRSLQAHTHVLRMR